MIKKLKEDEKIKTNIPDSPFEDDEEKDEEKDIEEMMNMNYKTMMGFSKKQQKEKVVKEHKPSIIDNLKEEFGLDEGPAYEYGDQISKIDKLYDVYWDAVKDLGRTLEKKGQGKLAKQLYMTYRKQVSKFSQWFSKFSGGLM